MRALRNIYSTARSATVARRLLGAPLRLRFTDFWPTFKPNHVFFLRDTRKRWVEVPDGQEYDLLICSVFGRTHQAMKGPKLQFSGEANGRFKLSETCDYYIVTDTDLPASLSGRSIFWVPFGPVHCNVEEMYSIWKERRDSNWETILRRKTKFCCFVVSNATDGIGTKARNAVFEKLDFHLGVDSAGTVLNNVGYRAPRGKAFLEWISRYKYMICFENTAAPGYITEKVFNAWGSGTVPIYWGDPSCLAHLNEEAMLFVRPNESADSVLARVLESEERNEWRHIPRRCILHSDPRVISSPFNRQRAIDHFNGILDSICK